MRDTSRVFLAPPGDEAGGRLAAQNLRSRAAIFCAVGVGLRLRSGPCAEDDPLRFGHAGDLRRVLQEILADHSKIGLEHGLSGAGINEAIEGLVALTGFHPLHRGHIVFGCLHQLFRGELEEVFADKVALKWQ